MWREAAAATTSAEPNEGTAADLPSSAERSTLTTVSRPSIRRVLGAAIVTFAVAAAPGAGRAQEIDPLGPAPGHDAVGAETPVVIPDGSIDGATSTITTESFGAIKDLDLRVRLDHGAIGQLTVSLTHVPTNRTVTLLDRPTAADGSPCTGDDADMVLDTDADTTNADTLDPAGTSCRNGERPALVGRLASLDDLRIFAGENIAGAWELSVRDSETGETGRLVSWQLHVELALDGFDVAVLAADSSATRRLEVINRLAEDPRVDSVTSLSVDRAAPPIDAATLGRFDAVVVYTRSRPANASRVGDALADYVDEGGGVVLAGFATHANLGLAGRITEDAYQPLGSGDGFELLTRAQLTAVESDHPILDGITTVSAPSRVTGVTAADGAQLLATWSNEAATPLAAVRMTTAGRLVGLNLYPVSDALDIIGYDTGSDAFALFTNAVVWSGRPVVTCDGLVPTIEGTTGPDELVGTSGRDVIVAYGGADVIAARDGRDVVCGGRGNDRIIGGPSRDRLFGERGRDVLFGASGSDRADGGAGLDVCRAEVRASCGRRPS